jgi:hypothetical protein
MPGPIITDDIVFQKISSPLGQSNGSPFDKALANRDKILTGYIKKINRRQVTLAPSQTVLLSDSWGNEVQSNIAAIFPGLGDFGPGGGPLS